MHWFRKYFLYLTMLDSFATNRDQGIICDKKQGIICDKKRAFGLYLRQKKGHYLRRKNRALFATNRVLRSENISFPSVYSILFYEGIICDKKKGIICDESCPGHYLRQKKGHYCLQKQGIIWKHPVLYLYYCDHSCRRCEFCYNLRVLLPLQYWYYYYCY